MHQGHICLKHKYNTDTYIYPALCACIMGSSDASNSPASASKRSKQGKATITKSVKDKKDQKHKDKEKEKHKVKQKDKQKDEQKDKQKDKQKVKQDKPKMKEEHMSDPPVQGLPTPPQSPGQNETNMDNEDKKISQQKRPAVNQGDMPEKQPRHADENKQNDVDKSAAAPATADRSSSTTKQLRHDDEVKEKEMDMGTMPAQESGGGAEQDTQNADKGPLPKPLENIIQLKEDIGMDNQLSRSQYCWNGPVVQRQPWEIAFIQQGFEATRPGRWSVPPREAREIQSLSAPSSQDHHIDRGRQQVEWMAVSAQCSLCGCAYPQSSDDCRAQTSTYDSTPSVQ